MRNDRYFVFRKRSGYQDYFIWDSKKEAYLTFESPTDAYPYKGAQHAYTILAFVYICDIIDSFETIDDLKEKYFNWRF